MGKLLIKGPEDNTMALNSYLSIVTLNVNGLKAPFKRHRLSDWIKKQDASICCLQEIHFRPKDIPSFLLPPPLLTHLRGPPHLLPRYTNNP